MGRIYLIGYMGTGKTTLGKELAKSFEVEFIDLDHYIQENQQKTIAEIFEEGGEAGFREIENQALKSISTTENVIISTGGGTPCFFDNMEYMNKTGTTIYLRATAEALCERLNICKEKRPLIKDKNEEELYLFVKENLTKREPHYLKADIIFETDNLISREEIGNHVSGVIDLLTK